MLPTPCARDGKGPGHQYGLPDLIERGGPTKHAADKRTGGDTLALLPARTASQCGRSRAGSRAGVRPDHLGPTRDVLLPTPRASDGAKGSPRQRGSRGDPTLPAAGVAIAHGERGADWGPYKAAVSRWEQLLGRPVPTPTQLGRTGRPVLSPPFVEWLMGLPAGYVTRADLNLPRTQALRVLGNGVVPQQAATALRILLCPRRWATTA